MSDPKQTTTGTPCPECGGRWLRDILRQCSPDCSRYRAELSPREADHREPHRRALREPTPTELTIIEELGYEQPPEGSRFAIGVIATPVYVRRVLIVRGKSIREAEIISTTTTTSEEKLND